MICLLDLGLMVVPPDWQTIDLPIEEYASAVSCHATQLEQHAVRLAWHDVYTEYYPWCLPNCPPDLIDVCNVLCRAVSYAGSNDLLIESPSDAVEVEAVLYPELLDDGVPPELRQMWHRSVMHLAAHLEPFDDEVLIASEASRCPTSSFATIVNAQQNNCRLDRLPIISGESDWRVLWDRLVQINLDGMRVAVLGGDRQHFERASQELVERYNIGRIIRLPPHFEQNRSQNETHERLQGVDHVLVITSCLKHVDTAHLRYVEERRRGSLNVIYSARDSKNAIVDSILAIPR